LAPSLFLASELQARNPSPLARRAKSCRGVHICPQRRSLLGWRRVWLSTGLLQPTPAARLGPRAANI